MDHDRLVPRLLEATQKQDRHQITDRQRVFGRVEAAVDDARALQMGAQPLRIRLLVE